jgi:alpha-D-ribose 1-methylphosphonate 5-triphosphate diphosphatase
MTETILTNATLVFENETRNGTIAFNETGITGLDFSRSSLPSAIDVEGDYVTPGIVEMHTDNMEKHFVPRPGVFWPNGLAAALAHDAQMASAGVTTVYDSICAGSIYGQKDYRREIFGRVIEAVTEGQTQQAFRIDHAIHIRCELTGDELISDVEPFADHPLIRLISLMDHTPGKRQWRNLADLKRYNLGSGEKTEEQHDADVATRMEIGPRNMARNWPVIVDMFRSRGIPIATHDDTTEEDVVQGVESGAVISEFPTTVAAATAAKKNGLATILGAPNVVRGGSHSGGVSAAELATLGLLDGLSSDYVPASLLQAVLKLNTDYGIAFADAMAKVTWKVADMVGLSDRGRLALGKRADILRFSAIGPTPIVRMVWSNGNRAF